MMRAQLPTLIPALTAGGSPLDLHSPPRVTRLNSIDLLIRDFNYHVNFKRWNDTFSAVPFRPK